MAVDVLDYSFVEVTVRSGSTETPQKYYLHTGVVSIGCAATDGIRMPELTEESLLRIKINGNSVFIQSSNPAEIIVNNITLKDSNWLEVKDESKIKVSSVEVNVKIVKQVKDNLGSNRNKSTNSSPDMSSQDERAAVLDTQPVGHGPVYERNKAHTEDDLPSTQAFVNESFSLNKSMDNVIDKAHTEDDLPSSQAFNNESFSLNKSMDNVKGMDKMDVLPPTQIFMSDEFAKSDSHLQYMKDKEHTEEDLPSTQVFVNESFNLNNSMDNVKDEERLDVLPPTQIFMSDEFDKTDSHLQYVKDKEHTEEDLPSTQVFVNESFNLSNSLNNVKDKEHTEEDLPSTQVFVNESFNLNNSLNNVKDKEHTEEDLPSTQVFVNESFNLNNSLSNVKDRELAVQDLPSTQPFVPENSNSCTDNVKEGQSKDSHNEKIKSGVSQEFEFNLSNVKEGQSKDSHNEKIKSGASQEFEFNLSNVKVEPIEPSPEIQIIPHDYNALEAKVETIENSPPKKVFSYARSSPREVDFEAREAKDEVIEDYQDLQMIKKSSEINMMENNKSYENSDAEYREGCEILEKKTKSCSNTEYSKVCEKYNMKSDTLKTLIKDADKRKVGLSQHCSDVLDIEPEIGRRYDSNPEVQKLISNAAKKNSDRNHQNTQDGHSPGQNSGSETGKKIVKKVGEHAQDGHSPGKNSGHETGKKIVKKVGEHAQDGHSPGQNSGSETGKKIVKKVGEHVDHSKGTNGHKKRQAHKRQEVNTGATFKKVFDQMNMNVLKKKRCTGKDVNMEARGSREVGSSFPNPVLMSVSSEQSIKKSKEHVKDDSSDRMSTTQTGQQSMIKADEHVLNHCKGTKMIKKNKVISGELCIESRVQRVEDDCFPQKMLSSENGHESVITADEHVNDDANCLDQSLTNETGQQSMLKADEHVEDGFCTSDKVLTSQSAHESIMKADVHVQNLQSSSGEKSASETGKKHIIKAGEHDLCLLPQTDVFLPLIKVNLSRSDDMNFCDENAAKKSLKSVGQVNVTNKVYLKRKCSSLSQSDCYAELENVREKRRCTRAPKSNSICSYSKDHPKCDDKMNSTTNSSSHENTKDHCEMENVGSVAGSENHTANISCETSSKVTLRYSLRPKIAKRTCQCCDSSKSHMKHQKHESEACHRSQLQTIRKIKHDSQSEKDIDMRYTLRKRAKFAVDIQHKTGCKSKKNAKSISVSNDDIKKIQSRRPVILIRRLSQSAIAQLCRTGFNKHQPVNIMFTGKEVPKGREIAKKLNGKVIENHKRCTHLISDEVKRTKKFLCCLASGIPIVSKDWLLQSNKAGYFIDHLPYLLKDKNGEKKFRFNLEDTLQKSKKQRVFKGYSFYISKTGKISTNELKEIIHAAGGKVLRAPPSSNMKKTYIISDKNEKAASKKKLPKSSTKTVPSDFVFEAVMKYNHLC